MTLSRQRANAAKAQSCKSLRWCTPRAGADRLTISAARAARKQAIAALILGGGAS